MKRPKVLIFVTSTFLGTVFGGGCGGAVRDAAVQGSLDFVTNQVNNVLDTALPLDIFLSDFIRQTLGPEV